MGGLCCCYATGVNNILFLSLWFTAVGMAETGFSVSWESAARCT